MLTQQLRQLEDSGVVRREVRPGRVVRTEYSLSAQGEALRPVRAALAEWGLVQRQHRRGA